MDKGRENDLPRSGMEVRSAEGGLASKGESPQGHGLAERGSLLVEHIIEISKVTKK